MKLFLHGDSGRLGCQKLRLGARRSNTSTFPVVILACPHVGRNIVQPSSIRLGQEVLPGLWTPDYARVREQAGGYTSVQSPDLM